MTGIDEPSASALWAIMSEDGSRGVRLRGQIERPNQEVEGGAVLATGVAIEPSQAVAGVRHIAGNRDLVGHAGLRAARGNPLPGALQLPDLDAFGNGALGRFLPTLGAFDTGSSSLHLNAI
jgi:hypothetical protein